MSTSRVTGLSRKKLGRLSVLPTLALDVLFEVRSCIFLRWIKRLIICCGYQQIFGHLAPIDLLQLSRVSKSFRQVLMAKSSAWLWRSTWNSIPGTPATPEDVSEPAWTQLLFGGAVCYVCTLFVPSLACTDDVSIPDLWWQDE